MDHAYAAVNVYRGGPLNREEFGSFIEAFNASLEQQRASSLKWLKDIEDALFIELNLLDPQTSGVTGTDLFRLLKKLPSYY